MRHLATAFLLTVSALFLTGCSDPIDLVKNGTFEGREQTSVGNALDSYFAEPTGTQQVAPNKTQYVDFKGTAKQDITLSDAFIVPKESALNLVFVIKQDDSFELSGVWTKLAPNPRLNEMGFDGQLAFGLVGVKLRQRSEADPQAYKNGLFALDVAESSQLMDAVYSN